MPGFAPISTLPISALPDNSIGEFMIECDTIIEARMDNPLAELVTDPRKQLVLAVQITAVPLNL